MKTPTYQIMVSFEESTMANRGVKDLEDKVNHAMDDGYEPIGGLSVVIGSNNKIVLMQAVTLPKEVIQRNTVQNTVVCKNTLPRRDPDLPRDKPLLDLAKVASRNVV